MNLTAFINVGIYSVPEEKKEQFMVLSKKISEHVKKNTLLSKAILSRRLYTRCMGGEYGQFVDVWEFRSWTDYDMYLKSYAEDQEWAAFWKEFMLLVDQSKHKWINLDEVP